MSNAQEFDGPLTTLATNHARATGSRPYFGKNETIKPPKYKLGQRRLSTRELHNHNAVLKNKDESISRSDVPCTAPLSLPSGEYGHLSLTTGYDNN
eukprot:6174069-Pleurochrysis_carterae.AAC.1